MSDVHCNEDFSLLWVRQTLSIPGILRAMPYLWDLSEKEDGTLITVCPFLNKHFCPGSLLVPPSEGSKSYPGWVTAITHRGKRSVAAEPHLYMELDLLKVFQKGPASMCPGLLQITAAAEGADDVFSCDTCQRAGNVLAFLDNLFPTYALWKKQRRLIATHAERWTKQAWNESRRSRPPLPWH